MRAKVIIPALGLALLVLAPVVYLHFKPDAPPPDATPAPDQVAAAPAVIPAILPKHHHLTAGPANGGEGVAAPDGAADPAAADHEQYVQDRQAELTQLGMSDDPNDLKTILSEMNNKDSRIRSSALSAAVQFGSKDAIPVLQNEESWTDDPDEKVAILNAIKYLQLPSFDDFQASVAASAPPISTDQAPPAN